MWFHDEPSKNNGTKLGRWLGVSHRVGSALCYHVIKENGSVESRTTVQHVPMEDLLKPDIEEQVQVFNDNLSNRLKDDNFQLEEGECLIYEDEDVDEYENDNVNFIQSDVKETIERDDYDDDAYDQLL